MIWDCIIFGGELDILEIRLRYLSSVCDLRFTICESNKTFSGKDKPYYLAENWQRFAPFHHLIDYIQIEQDPSEFVFREVTSYDETNGPFLMEAQMRAGLMHINDKVKESDLCVLSDVDEIWYKALAESTIPPYPIALSMNFYGYYVNLQNISGPDINWGGSVACSGKHWLSTTPQQLRDSRNTNRTSNILGWHFSWLGNIKKKIQSFAHVEFDRPDITDEEVIKRIVDDGGDVLQRPGVRYETVSMNTFPEDLETILLDYPHLIKL